MSALQTASDHLSLGAYAAVGAIDSTAKSARDLVERRDEVSKEIASRFDTIVKDVRGQVTETVEDFRERMQTQRVEARKRVETYAKQGEVVVKNLRGGADEAFDRARKTADAAVSEVRDGDVIGAVKKAKAVNTTFTSAELKAKTKAELLDLASAKDVDGRSNMTKAQLVGALSA